MPVTPHPKTPAEVAATVKGYERQIKHFEERKEEARAAIRRLTGQTSLHLEV